MLHVATVHYRSPRWIEIQTEHLRRHISVPFQTWSSLEHIDHSYGVHFDRILEQRGSHAGKLNHMASEISYEAADSDLLMFLDGDAFPIADPMPLITEGLSRAPLIAVRRAENVDEPQPHPCFCVTTVGLWRKLPGDWTAGPTWPGAQGKPTTDVGGNLLRKLEHSGTPWVELLRSNKTDLDRLYYAIYANTVYHHGAGFRTGELSPADRAFAPKALPFSRVPVLGSPLRVVNRTRWRSWERHAEARHLRQSKLIYEKLRRGDADWLDELI